MKRLTALLFLLFSNIAFSESDKIVYLYTYYDKPPFAVNLDKKIGLSFDFAQFLNKCTASQRYQVKYVPRKRIDTYKSKIVLWTNPFWVNDSKLENNLWLQDLFKDQEVYITNLKDFKFKSPESMFSYSMATVRGYKYFELVDMFGKDKIQRVDVSNERQS